MCLFLRLTENTFSNDIHLHFFCKIFEIDQTDRQKDRKTSLKLLPVEICHTFWTYNLLSITKKLYFKVTAPHQNSPKSTKIPSTGCTQYTLPPKTRTGNRGRQPEKLTTITNPTRSRQKANTPTHPVWKGKQLHTGT